MITASSMTRRHTPGSTHLSHLPPEVGRWYWVPCLLVPRRFLGMHWLPTLGHKHRDAELGAPWLHIHVDWRFVPEPAYRMACRGHTGKPHGAVISNDDPAWSWQSEPGNLTGEPVLLLRKCRRAMPTFPNAVGGGFARLEAAHLNGCARLKDGHTCPHRGIDLRPFAGADGIVICPGHGLRWDLNTGLALPHHTAPPVLDLEPPLT